MTIPADYYDAPVPSLLPAAGADDDTGELDPVDLEEGD